MRDVLQSLAQLGDRNLVVDPTVSGTISLELREVPFQEALTIVTRSQGLDCREKGGTLWVGSPENWILYLAGFPSIHFSTFQPKKPPRLSSHCSLRP